MKLTGWMKTTFAGVLSIGVLSSSAAAQGAPQEPTREVHLVTASTPRERQIELALSAAPTEVSTTKQVTDRTILTYSWFEGDRPVWCGPLR
jgi:hypothetical protein